MAYADIADMTKDHALIDRLTACVAVEDRSPDPVEWTYARLWHLCSSPGWAEAYSYALATGASNPGRAEAVISDAMILAAIQAVIT